MLVFPLVGAGSEDGKMGWGRGIIALQRMWLSSFAPDRVLDTWDFRTDRLFRDQQLLGSDRHVTETKIQNVCAACDTQNYTTGTLAVSEDAYEAKVKIRGEHGEVEKMYTGKKGELNRLPCLVALDVIEYMKVPLSEQQRSFIHTPPVSSTELFDEIGDELASDYYFKHYYRAYWWEVRDRDWTPWTEFVFLRAYAWNRSTTVLAKWQQYGPRTECVAYDFIKANVAFIAATHGGPEYVDVAGQIYTSLFEKDPLNPYVVRGLAGILGFAGEEELAEKVANRLFLIYGDSFLGPLHHGLFLFRLSSDVRGMEWSYVVAGMRGIKGASELFAQRYERARAELEHVAKLEPRCWDVNRALIAIAAWLRLPREYAEERLNRVIEHCPTDFEAHMHMLGYLSPDWCGSKEECLEFARRCAKSELYRARIPGVLLEAYWCYPSFITGKTGQESWKECFRREDVYAEIEPVLRRLTDENPHDYRDVSYWLAVAYWRGDRELVRKLLVRVHAEKGVIEADYIRQVIWRALFKEICKWAAGEQPPPG